MIVEFIENYNHPSSNYSYIEKTIKSYIVNNNFPKNLVVTKLQAEITKIKGLDNIINERTNKIKENIDNITKSKNLLKKDNEEKTKRLLQTFSNSVF